MDSVNRIKLLRIALVLSLFGVGLQKASADLQVDTYLHCGDYSGPNPDVSLVRYSAEESIFGRPTWPFTYAVKTPAKIRTEVACLATGFTQRADGSILFSGENCSVTLTQEADQTYSVTYASAQESEPKIMGCVFDVPLSQLLQDFNTDLNTTGVGAPLVH